jgi:hypothetical protein
MWIRKISIIYFWRGIGLFLVCLTVSENVGMPKNYRFMLDYEYQKKERNLPAEI